MSVNDNIVDIEDIVSNYKIKPNLLSDFTQTQKEGKMAIEVHSPQCPNCLNVDGRLTLKHDKKNATIVIIQSFATSGHIVKIGRAHV